MKMILDGFEITGTEIQFSTLIIKMETIAKAFGQLAIAYPKSVVFSEIQLEYQKKAYLIACAIEREGGNHDI